MDSVLYSIEFYDEEVVGFDLDYTLVKPKRTKFPKDKNDYVYMFDMDKLRNKNILIFTNQKNCKQHVKDKIEIIKEELFETYNIKMNYFILTKNDKYRKPMPTVYDLCKKVCGCTMTKYVGDACGRESDFSDSDYKFAINIGVDFNTPEEFFLNAKKDYELEYIDLDDHIGEYKYEQDEKEVTILIGYPASGKSSFAKMFENVINQDTLKTRKKCLKVYKNMLKTESKIVIDNTNTTLKRSEYIDLAKEHEFKVVGIEFVNDLKFVRHLDNMRCLLTDKKISIIVYRKIKKNYVKPTLDEGFDELLEIKTLIQNPPYEYYYKYDLKI